MRFLFVCEGSAMLPVAKRVEREGNTVHVFIKDSLQRRAGEGIVAQVPNLGAALVRNPEVVVFDSATLTREAHVCQRRGIPCFGGTDVANVLERRPELARDLCRQRGVHVAPSEEFAAEFVKGGPRLTTQALYAGGRPVGPAFGWLAQRRFLAGDMGPATECESVLAWNYEAERPRAVELTLRKLDPFLKTEGYTGFLSVEAILGREDQEPWFVGLKASPSFDALYGWVALLKGEVGKVLADVAAGKGKGIAANTQDIAATIRVSVPPYPQSATIETGGSVVASATPDDPGYFWRDVREVAGLLSTCGGVVGVMVGVDRHWKGAVRKARRLAAGVEVPEKQYRVDAGDQGRDLARLAEWGYLNDYRKEKALDRKSQE